MATAKIANLPPFYGCLNFPVVPLWYPLNRHVSESGCKVLNPFVYLVKAAKSSHNYMF